MKAAKLRSVLIFILLLCIAAGAMYFADRIQRDNGAVTITDGTIPTKAGDIAYKLYTPQSASASAKAPGVLLLHGYQNDHETNAAYAIELARRGAVVLSIDEYGHGAADASLISRGYVNRVVKVNYGNESEADGTIKAIGGSKRYRVLMNFSNLSFFDEKYTKDDAGNAITDSTCGGTDAYAFLASLPEVDDTRLAVSGHSMGTWSGWSVAADYSDKTNAAGESIAPKAIVLQCGELFRSSVYDAANIHFNNVLLLQAKYDEFSYFRDYQWNVTDALLRTPLRYEFLGATADNAAWNTTFGQFENGTARRMQLLNTNHRLTTHNREGLATAMTWFDEAIDLPKDLAPTDQTAMLKEYLVLLAMLCVLFAMFPLMDLLLGVPMFRFVKQDLPAKETLKKRGAWWRGAVITILIAGLTFPFMTQLGHALLPLPENIFRMTVGNGFIGWYILLILVMIVTTLIGKGSAKKKGEKYDWNAAGLSSTGKKHKINVVLLLKALILANLLVGMVYGVNVIFTKVFDLDLRFIWPFFRPFTKARLGQFFVYIPFFMLFYVLNNGKIMGTMRIKASHKTGAGYAFLDWLKNFFLMAGGLILVCLIEYIPFFAGIGPGADVLFGSTFGGPFMSILILFVPQVFFFSILCTYCYRKTHNAYTGAFVAALISCWIVTGGSAML